MIDPKLRRDIKEKISDFEANLSNLASQFVELKELIGLIEDDSTKKYIESETAQVEAHFGEIKENLDLIKKAF